MAGRAGEEANETKSAGFIEVGRASSLPGVDHKRDSETLALHHSSQHDTGVYSAEAERVAHDMIQFGGPAMVRHDIEIARRIGILIIDCRRHPLLIESERAGTCFDCAGRA